MIVDPLDKSLSAKTECKELRVWRSICSHANIRNYAAWVQARAFLVIKN